MSAGISVVMAVYNGAADVAGTVDSVLAQEGVELEFIIVDDGSTDDTPSLLAGLAARDSRVRVMTQANAGITSALILGCDAARAPIIARQDCGDRSRAGRLAQSLWLFDDPAVVLASVHVAFIGPRGEPLFVKGIDGEVARRSLLSAKVDQLEALPHHGSAMFRTDSYRQAGGYRREFYFAQDIDLWMRLVAIGEIAIAPAVLYEARVDTGTISGRYRAEQIASSMLAIELRDSMSSEETAGALAAVAAIRPAPSRNQASRRREADALYFVASCLLKNGDPRSRDYLWRAVRANPLQWRAWIRLLQRNALHSI